MTPSAFVLITGALALALADPAAAHSLLLESSPAAGSVMATAPAAISLVFNNRIEKPLCRLRLVDGQGRARTLTIDADGPANRLHATTPELGAGLWRVEWIVMSADGHVVSGAFSFRVGP